MCVRVCVSLVCVFGGGRCSQKKLFSLICCALDFVRYVYMLLIIDVLIEGSGREWGIDSQDKERS